MDIHANITYLVVMGVFLQVFQDEPNLSRKLHSDRCNDHNVAGKDERALKRPRLIHDWAERQHNSSSTYNFEQVMVKM